MSVLEDLLDWIGRRVSAAGPDSEVRPSMAPADAPGPAGCPSCATDLVPRVTGLACCPAGCGELVTHEVMARLMEDPAMTGASLETIASKPPPATAADDAKPRRCPTCGAWMLRTNYMRVSGVMVDRCVAHGTWCDAGELRRLFAFLQSGGAARREAFDRSQQDHLDRVRASIPSVDWDGSPPDLG